MRWERVTNGQVGLAIFAVILSGFLGEALWKGEVGYPAVADRNTEPKLYWAGIAFYAVMILGCLIVPLVI